MSHNTLRGHYDGNQIILDEPFQLEPNVALLITVLSDEDVREEREDFATFSLQGLRYAYADDEPEYSFDMIKEPNASYQIFMIT